MEKLIRRFALVAIGAFLATGIVASTSVWAQNAQNAEDGKDAKDAKPIRVIVFDGGHPYDEPAFAEMLASFGDRFEFTRARLPEDWKLLTPGLEKKFDVALFYDMCQAPLTDADRAAFDALTRREIGLFYLHHHICAQPNWPGFERYAGGAYVFEQNRNIGGGDPLPLSDYKHGLEIDVRPAVEPSDAPFALEAFKIVDEGYSNVWVDSNAKILLETETPGSSREVAWVWRRAHRAPALVFLLGHDALAYNNAGFRRFLKNGIEWLAANKTIDAPK